MDTTTGKILTSDEVEVELDKAMKQAGKESEFVLERKIKNAMSPGLGMSMDEAMAKFLPDIKPLKNLPDPKCKRCYGLGNLGKNLTTGKYVPCSCTQ